MSTVHDALPAQIQPKLYTAEQVKTDCPAELRRLGTEITARLKKADRQIQDAENHAISIHQRVSEAKALCDDGGFIAFQEKFFPNLAKSRVYELRAILAGKTSIEETRLSTRKRVAEHRANKAAASASVTVTESSMPELGVQEDSIQAIGAPAAQTLKSGTPRSRIASDDGAMRHFNEIVRELDRIIAKHPPKRFLKTAVSPTVLTQRGQFLTDLATLKQSEIAEATPLFAPDSGGSPDDRSVGDDVSGAALPQEHIDD